MICVIHTKVTVSLTARSSSSSTRALRSVLACTPFGDWSILHRLSPGPLLETLKSNYRLARANQYRSNMFLLFIILIPPRCRCVRVKRGAPEEGGKRGRRSRRVRTWCVFPVVEFCFIIFWWIDCGRPFCDLLLISFSAYWPRSISTHINTLGKGGPRVWDINTATNAAEWGGERRGDVRW